MIYKPFTNKSTPLIIEDIRECLKEDLPSQITIDTGDLPHLIGEIERLNNIINELEQWLEEAIENISHVSLDGASGLDMALKKIKELKELIKSE